MRSVISRRVGMSMWGVIGRCKPENGGYWRYSSTMIENQRRGKMGEIRSATATGLRNLWDQQQRSHYSMKHQEIEGPTVEKDMSDLGIEAREVNQSTMKAIYQLSKAVAALGVSQLAIGAYILSSSSSSSSSSSVSVLTMSVSAVAFGFPFSMAILMRQSLKSMHFFHKMEHLGRLQLLTSTMQLSKQLRLFFLRLRLVSYTSLSALLLSFLYSLFSPLFFSP